MKSCLQLGLPALLYVCLVCEEGLGVLSPTSGQADPSLIEGDRGGNSSADRELEFTFNGVVEQTRKASEFDSKDVAKQRDAYVNDYESENRVDVHPKTFWANVGIASPASPLPHVSHRLQVTSQAENKSSEFSSGGLASNISLLGNKWQKAIFAGSKKRNRTYGDEARRSEPLLNYIDEKADNIGKETAAIQSEGLEDAALEPIIDGDSADGEAAEGQEEAKGDAEIDTGAEAEDDDDDDDNDDDSSDDDDDDDDDDQTDYTEPSGMAYYYRAVYYGASYYYHTYYHRVWEGGWGYGFGWRGWNDMSDADEDDYDGSGSGGA